MNDYIKHIGAGILAAVIVALPVWLECNNLFCGLWACIAGVIAGVIKEWCDNTYNWQWSWKDLAWTCVGVLVAVLFIVALHFGKG